MAQSLAPVIPISPSRASFASAPWYPGWLRDGLILAGVPRDTAEALVAARAGLREHADAGCAAILAASGPPS